MTTLLAAIRAHVPTDLHPLILEYADDSLEVFLRARIALLRHFKGYDGRRAWEYNRQLESDQEVCWTLYYTKFRPLCTGYYVCLQLVYQSVKHKQPIACLCTDPLMASCVPWCGACTSQSIQ